MKVIKMFLSLFHFHKWSEWKALGQNKYAFVGERHCSKCGVVQTYQSAPYPYILHHVNKNPRCYSVSDGEISILKQKFIELVKHKLYSGPVYKC